MPSSPPKNVISSERVEEVLEIKARLSPRARETFDQIARPYSAGEDPDRIAETVGLLSGSDVTRAMRDLQDEIEALRTGAQLPPLTADERDGLRTSLEELGQLVPILIDENGEILDGTNRHALLTELGITPDTHTIVIGDNQERRHAVRVAANTARRQLSTSAKQRAIRDEILHDPGRSDRSIAAMIGVDHHTVARARRELEQEGQVLRLDTRVGKDGVAQPAAKANTPPARKPAQTESAPETPPALGFTGAFDATQSVRGAVVFTDGPRKIAIGEQDWRQLGEPASLSVSVRAA